MLQEKLLKSTPVGMLWSLFVDSSTAGKTYTLEGLGITAEGVGLPNPGVAVTITVVNPVQY